MALRGKEKSERLRHSAHHGNFGHQDAPRRVSGQRADLRSLRHLGGMLGRAGLRIHRLPCSHMANTRMPLSTCARFFHGSRTGGGDQPHSSSTHDPDNHAAIEEDIKEKSRELEELKKRQTLLASNVLSETMLYPWQRNILEMVEKKAHDRHVCWYHDEGNSGKSALAKLLVKKYDALLLADRAVDIKHRCQISEWVNGWVGE